MSIRSRDIIKRGLLIKQGGKVKTWKHRLFCLDPINLTYYDNNSGVAKGVIPLENITDVRMGDASLFYGTLWELETPNRTFLLRASTPIDAQAWVDTITEMIKKEEQV